MPPLPTSSIEQIAGLLSSRGWAMPPSPPRAFSSCRVLVVRWVAGDFPFNHCVAGRAPGRCLAVVRGLRVAAAQANKRGAFLWGPPRWRRVLTLRAASLASGHQGAGPMLLIVMYGVRHLARSARPDSSRSGEGRRAHPPSNDQGRTRSESGASRRAWWLRNDSSSSVLYLSGDRGFRVDLPPGMSTPAQQWHASRCGCRV